MNKDKRILIADDALFIRLILKDILVKGGYEVCGEATNGEEAVRLYEELLPDAVMLDITMPVMDGIEALKGIRRLDPKARVLICSAMGQRKFVLDAIRAGASDFIIKPFQPSKIYEALRRIVG